MIDGSGSSDSGSGLGATIFPGIGTTANTAMTQSPVLFWRFSETAGTTVADSSGDGNIGVAGGGYTRNTTPGAFSTDTDPAITFTAASNGKVVGASPVGIPSGTASRSVSVWFKTTTTTQQALTSYGCTSGVTGCSAGQNFGFFVKSSTSLMTWGWGGGEDLTFNTGSTVTDGNWHQAVETYNGSTNSMTVYLDGTSLGSQTPTTPLNTVAPGAQGFNVGVAVPVDDASNGGKYFNGSIDDVSVYSGVLTPAQISAQYAARALPVGFTGVGAVATGSPWQSPSYSWTTSATTAPGGRDAARRRRGREHELRQPQLRRRHDRADRRRVHRQRRRRNDRRRQLEHDHQRHDAHDQQPHRLHRRRLRRSGHRRSRSSRRR